MKPPQFISIYRGITKQIAHLISTYWLPLLLLFPPLFYSDEYFLHIMISALIMGVLASSWNLMLGYTGIFSFGHQAFFGIGAYSSALFSMYLGLSPWIGIIVAGFGSTLFSLVISIPCLRFRDSHFVAIATLSFAEICRITTTNLVGITRGELGLWGIPNLFHANTRIPYYYTILAILTLVLIIMDRIDKTPIGLAMKSVRDAEEAAELLGVNVAQTKVIAFGISAFMASIAGAFYAHYILLLTPSSVQSVGIMVEIVTVTLIGGLGTLTGPAIAALCLTVGLEYLRGLGEYRLLIYGASLVILIIYLPEGVVPKVQTFFSKKKEAKDNSDAF